jgi:ribonuclease P protein component
LSICSILLVAFLLVSRQIPMKSPLAEVLRRFRRVLDKEWYGMFKLIISKSLCKRRHTGRFHEENLPTEYDQQKEDARIFTADEYQRGKTGIETQKGQGEKTADGITMPRQKDEGLRKDERLRREADFEIIVKEGMRRHTKNFLIIARKNDQGYCRVGAVASKKVGNAVERNRVKRLVREFFRRNKDKLPVSTDYVIVGKKGAQNLRYAHVVTELSEFWKLHRQEDNQRSGGAPL